MFINESYVLKQNTKEKKDGKTNQEKQTRISCTYIKTTTLIQIHQAWANAKCNNNAIKGQNSPKFQQRSTTQIEH